MRSIRRPDRLLCLLTCLWTACPSLPERPRYLGAGNQGPVRGGTLMLWEEQRVRLLDPHQSSDQMSNIIISMVFDSLYDYDRDVKLVPQLAAALPTVSADGKTLTIPLRRGVRFHNGRELNARDVLWSFERMLHPSLGSPGAPYYRAILGLREYQSGETSHVRGLSTPDAYTFRIELERPDRSFVFTLAMRYAAPLAREETSAPRGDPKRRPVGTGPFRFVSWDPGVRIVLERHGSYHRPGKPYLDRVVFEEGLKRDIAMMRFRNGELDIVPRMSAADSMLMKTPAWKSYAAVSPQADVFAIFMNVELPPFDNVHVRRAVAAAIDRERWCRARNYAIRPAGQILPPKVMGHDEQLPHLQRFDLQRARREMKLAGFADGLPAPVTLWTSASATGRQYGELFIADMAKIGIEVALKPVSFPVYLEETGKPKTAQLVAGGWSLDFPDASNIFNLVSRTGIAPRDSTNRSFYSDPHLEDILERAIVEGDPLMREALYREANDFVADAAPWAVHSNTQALQSWQPYVKGYAPHPMHWLGVNDVWLDLPRKRVASLLGDVRWTGALATLFRPWGEAR